MSASHGVAVVMGRFVLVGAAIALLVGTSARGAADHPTAGGASGRIDLPRRASSDPVRIAIPAIGVRARTVRLGLNRDRTLQVPHNYSETGWWEGGPRPGERGPAVVVGHVDSRTGPAVFYRLGKLRRGDVIMIRRGDGRLARFVVQRLARYPKKRFPTRAVYGPTSRPTLRLITCSGSFDRSVGHYRDNTIVYAAYAPRR